MFANPLLNPHTQAVSASQPFHAHHTHQPSVGSGGFLNVCYCLILNLYKLITCMNLFNALLLKSIFADYVPNIFKPV